MAPEKPGGLKAGHWMSALAFALCAGISNFCFAVDDSRQVFEVAFSGISAERTGKDRFPTSVLAKCLLAGK